MLQQMAIAHAYTCMIAFTCFFNSHFSMNCTFNKVPGSIVYLKNVVQYNIAHNNMNQMFRAYVGLTNSPITKFL